MWAYPIFATILITLINTIIINRPGRDPKSKPLANFHKIAQKPRHLSSTWIVNEAPDMGKYDLKTVIKSTERGKMKIRDIVHDSLSKIG